MSQFVTREHEIEPVPGLPGLPPAGEVILWQGRPSANLLSRHLLKVRWIGGYFLLLAAWAVISGLHDGREMGGLVFSVAILAALAAVLVGMIELFAWAVEKTTLYTITTERVVMRFGVALSMTLNLPFRQVEAMSTAKLDDKAGMIAMAVAADTRLSWLIQWPHVRGWRFSRPEPCLVYLPEVDKVAGVLAAAYGQFRASQANPMRITLSQTMPVATAPAAVAAE
ncbi:MAG: photosynthetic complex putative assembly protein PuhB [Rhizobium sp.]|nr:photosynthetic complex putative assembly protein PuhB [Rhizobium sp.]